MVAMVIMQGIRGSCELERGQMMPKNCQDAKAVERLVKQEQAV